MTLIWENVILFISDYQLLILSILFSVAGFTFILDRFRFSPQEQNIYIKYVQNIILFYIISLLIKYTYLLIFFSLKNIKVFFLSVDTMQLNSEYNLLGGGLGDINTSEW